MRKKSSLKTLIKDNKGFIFIYLTLVTLATSLIVASVISYNYLISAFRSQFNNGQYSSANNIIINQQKYNPVKTLLINRDLQKFLRQFFDDVVSSYDNKELGENEALFLVKEVESYGFFNEDIQSFKTSLPTIKESEDNLKNGIASLNNEKYKEAIDSFSKVSLFDSNYKSALEYKKEAFNNYKVSIIDESKKLAEDKYYTKAIDLINNNLGEYISQDKEIEDLLASYESDKKNYLASTGKNSSTVAASASLPVISSSNINTLNLSSSTSMLIYVNKNTQKTYVYKGSKNSWKLDKTFSSSTGISGKDTPSGIFEVLEKGEWFFSEKYQQGGKYWVQFKGDYLFHSLPFAEDKKTIVDTTLGTPASHGCIRLDVANAKWLYENAKKGTKVIIN